MAAADCLPDFVGKIIGERRRRADRFGVLQSISRLGQIEVERIARRAVRIATRTSRTRDVALARTTGREREKRKCEQNDHLHGADESARAARWEAGSAPVAGQGVPRPRPGREGRRIRVPWILRTLNSALHILCEVIQRVPEVRESGSGSLFSGISGRFRRNQPVAGHRAPSLRAFPALRLPAARCGAPLLSRATQSEARRQDESARPQWPKIAQRTLVSRADASLRSV